MAMMMRAQVGRVLQGYFRIEQFRGATSRAVIAQPVPSGRGIVAPATSRPDLLPAKKLRAAQAAPHAAQLNPGANSSGVPRPDLLPAKMRAMVGQPKVEREASRAWSGAPRPELLPGMGPAIAGGLRGGATIAQLQSRTNQRVLTTPLPAGQLRVIGSGRPLESGIRREMEAFFQADFSDVRVHEGPAAQAMDALAFTLGEQIHFAPGLYEPTSREGLQLLGHELAHVVQQRDGRVVNPHRQGIAIVQDPVLEAEADAMGRRVAEELWSGTRVGQAKMERRGGGGCEARELMCPARRGDKRPREGGLDDAGTRVLQPATTKYRVRAVIKVPDLGAEFEATSNEGYSFDPHFARIYAMHVASRATNTDMETQEEQGRPVLQCAEPKALAKGFEECRQENKRAVSLAIKNVTNEVNLNEDLNKGEQSDVANLIEEITKGRVGLKLMGLTRLVQCERGNHSSSSVWKKEGDIAPCDNCKQALPRIGGTLTEGLMSGLNGQLQKYMNEHVVQVAWQAADDIVKLHRKKQEEEMVKFGRIQETQRTSGSLASLEAKLKGELDQLASKKWKLPTDMSLTFFPLQAIASKNNIPLVPTAESDLRKILQNIIKSNSPPDYLLEKDA